jgi:hypothetical protein
VVLVRESRQRRKDANNGVRAVVHLHDMTNHLRIARKTLLPEVVTEDEHGRRALLVFARLKGAAE